MCGYKGKSTHWHRFLQRAKLNCFARVRLGKLSIRLLCICKLICEYDELIVERSHLRPCRRQLCAGCRVEGCGGVEEVEGVRLDAGIGWIGWGGICGLGFE